MIRKKLALIVAPPAMQPGGYIMKAYADRTEPRVPELNVSVVRSARGFLIEVDWACEVAHRLTAGETDLFTDACALMAPETGEAQWLTMGAPGHAVEAAYWRADRERPWRMRAEGLGTMQRSEAPAAWSARGEWAGGRWQVRFELDDWAPLVTQKKLAIAVWSGQAGERAGLKSVTADWLALE
ncbi:MAG: hypothetical protein IPJ33_15810 [Gammaproteobacteria bacterium]|jgi:DMSO reductase family type II enzyme heme b subunit|nr:hypothetical protein [Gammaproteobacteria bacterium]MBP6053560.1 hypothetical protein [Pseudomonadales bacterium]MBK6583212.1 hypothetical protein [Gammaproteobacteria bacterium]MBK7170675.1 hypothetical protein [Gammaproteobacteria bacterium]MBK7519346.1 hypothetical protein [Gammaproteobacteria bacterium]